MEQKVWTLSNVGQKLLRKLRGLPVSASEKRTSKSEAFSTISHESLLNSVQKPFVVKILFVCTGNLCRSPTGQGVLQKLVTDAGLSDSIYVDSAGTHAYERGESPDPRMQATALDRGYDLSGYRTRRATESDLDHFDYVLAMDRQNLSFLKEMCAPDARDKVRLFMEFAPGHVETEVPDPYFGGLKGFHRALDLIEHAAQGLLEDIRNRYGL